MGLGSIIQNAVNDHNAKRTVKLSAWQIAYLEKAVKECNLDVTGKRSILELLEKAETINIKIKA